MDNGGYHPPPPYFHMLGDQSSYPPPPPYSAQPPPGSFSSFPSPPPAYSPPGAYYPHPQQFPMYNAYAQQPNFISPAIPQQSFPLNPNQATAPPLYPNLPPLDSTFVPSRPAPPPPRPPPPTVQQPTIGFGDSSIPSDAVDARWSNLLSSTHGSHPGYAVCSDKDTPLPAALQERWQCGGASLFLLQYDGYVVAPAHEVFLKVYLNPDFDASRCPSRRGSLQHSLDNSPTGTPGRNSPSGSIYSKTSESRPSPSGAVDAQQYSLLVECPRICRLKLSPARGHALVDREFIAFVDQGTKPCRSVVVKFPRGLDSRKLEELTQLLSQHASITTDNNGILTTVSSSVESAFNYSSKLGSDLLKDYAPGIAKSTKYFRKGAGNLVRLGGSLMTKGASLVAETVAPVSKDEKMAEFDPMVNQLRAALSTVKDQLNKGTVTYVTRGL